MSHPQSGKGTGGWGFDCFKGKNAQQPGAAQKAVPGVVCPMGGPYMGQQMNHPMANNMMQGPGYQMSHPPAQPMQPMIKLSQSPWLSSWQVIADQLINIDKRHNQRKPLSLSYDIRQYFGIQQPQNFAPKDRMPQMGPYEFMDIETQDSTRDGRRKHKPKKQRSQSLNSLSQELIFNIKQVALPLIQILEQPSNLFQIDQKAYLPIYQFQQQHQKLFRGVVDKYMNEMRQQQQEEHKLLRFGQKLRDYNQQSISQFKDSFMRLQQSPINETKIIKECQKNIFEPFTVFIQNLQKELKNEIAMRNHIIQKIYENFAQFLTYIAYLNEIEGFTLNPDLEYRISRKIQQKRRKEPKINANSFTSCFNVFIEKDNLQGLFQGQWISSAIILNYIEFLKKYYDFNGANQQGYILTESEAMGMGNPQIFISTIHYSGIFTRYKKVGIIINKNNTHWAFLGIDVAANIAIVYDSMYMVGDYHEYIEKANRFAEWEHNRNGLRYQRFRLITASENSEKQKNGDDCGIFTLMNMTKFLLLQPGASNYKLTFDDVQQRVSKLRIGLYLFCVYTIVCKRKSRMPQMGRLYALSIALMTEKDFMDIIDMQYDGKIETQ